MRIGVRILVRADASGAIAGLERIREDVLDLCVKLFYHDDLCGMNDGTEWDVFV